MKTIKINFWNWWGFGIREWQAMFHFLDYKFVLSPNPDFIVFSNTALRYMPKLESEAQKIFFMGEIIDTDMSMCDWSFGDNYIDNERHFRLPYYAVRMLYTGTPLTALLEKRTPQEVFNQKRLFCNFLFSNTADGWRRNAFFKKLSKYKKIDSAGESLNNMGHVLAGRWGVKVNGYTRYPEKMEFLSKYKFTIAFENNRSDYNLESGYTTEKLTEPMLVDSIPIYCGNYRVAEEFNTKSFFNHHDYQSEEELIEHIIEVDKRDSLYLQKLSEPWLIKQPDCLNYDSIKAQFAKIFG